MDCSHVLRELESLQGPGFVFTGSKESIRGSLDGVSLYIFHAVPHTLYTKF